jgi:N utilization substance protein B
MPAPGRERAPRQARRLAFQALFEGEFGTRTAEAALARLAEAELAADGVRNHARAIVAGVEHNRPALDVEIGQRAPAIPVSELGRVERSILRSALFELLYSAAAPGNTLRDAVFLARTYAGDAASRLVGGVLRSVTKASGEGDEG